MLIYELVLLVSALYLAGYAAYCFQGGRGGAGAASLLLVLPPVFLFVTLVCIS